MSEKSSYASIMKATSIFGGVQLFNIFITLIRSKAVAVLIGTDGMGLNGLFMSSINLIKTISSLGISESAVRDISKAHASEDSNQISKIFTVFNRWIWITAALGVLTTIVLSPVLSEVAFGSSKKWTSYIWLSTTFIFGALSGGIYTFLRGTRQIKYMARANIVGSIVGLVTALPVFYFYGIEGVLPAIILTAFGNYLVSLYFKNKVIYFRVNISWTETFNIGKPMIQLGLSLTVINVLSAAVSFTLSAFITKTGTLSDLGLYNAGNAIVDGYVGMVFMAMATDYFPRLAGVIHDDKKWKELVNQQAELILIILGIVLVFIITTTPLLIRILLSKDFLASQNFIMWAVLAIPLKGLVWVVGYIILAKGNNKLFLMVEIFANIIVLCFNVLFYHYFGLIGLGISLSISYLIVTIYMLVILKRKFEFKFFNSTYKLLFISILSLSLCLIIMIKVSQPYLYILHILVVFLTTSYYFIELNTRIKLKSIFLNLFGKIDK